MIRLPSRLGAMRLSAPRSYSIFARTPSKKTLPNPKGEPSAAPGSGTTGKKEAFVHDYSVRPTTYVYRMEDNAESFTKYPLMTSKKLAKNSTRPRGVRMTAKDFMDDSLYNPYYGYFSRNVEIFTTDKPFDYTNINDVDDFLNTWTGEYSKYAANSPTLTGQTKDTSHSGTFPAQDKDFTSRGSSKQLWHTPTELFKPYYGEALARYLLVNYKLSLYPYKDLIIYEMGGGNGTLMINILDYIRDTQPEVYERTRYRIIEISDQLAHKQQSSLHTKAAEKGHRSKVEIINKSIFDWKEPVNDPCFFVALEVFDNFAHDIVRYDNRTLQPYQGHVLVDANGDFHEVYTQKLDDWTKKFLQIRTESLEEYSPDTRLGFHPLSTPRVYKEMRNLMWPYHSELSDPEFIPTRYLEFLYILKKYFPQARLLSSDFTHLPQTSTSRFAGYNSPVVQTVLDNQMVTTNTHMVLQGYFDILFPTDFELAAQLLRHVCGRVPEVSTHQEFLEQWADLDATTTKTGENPMTSFYRNAAFLTN
ncbi:NADH dehydrogenase [ubiquinone] complex I, assembly factor 7-like protein [Yarrowia sp. C11]|nr:NADH dehydrogenase [ubiquinone] complex I, assembly factor 7-like protein [Yarrowia sp. C11]KAG5364197.1 NADH dehydrogenase [ubiquinone] complex I, assembly factor 7-like protein [Yarrowia sp. E02]